MTQAIVPEQFPLSGGGRYWVHHIFNPSAQFGGFSFADSAREINQK